MGRKLSLIGVACALTVCAGGLAAAPALGAGQAPAVADCNAHGQLTRSYSAKELQTALATMPADIKEYTDCYDVIQRALLGQVGSHHATNTGDSNGSGGSSFPTWLIVVLVLLVLAAATFGALAVRRRTPPGGPDGPPGGPGGPPGGPGGPPGGPGGPPGGPDSP